MGTDKRQRQKENRARRLEAEAKQAARDRRIATLRSLGTLIVASLIIGAGIIWFTNRPDDISGEAFSPPSTTAADSTSTSLADAETTTSTVVDTEGLSAAYTSYREQPVACGGELPPPLTPMSFDAPADMGIDPSATVTASITTSCGDLVLELDPAAAPNTVNSFVFLADQGYFDGVVSHRIAPGFVLQIGDQTATGSGGPGYSIEDELPADSSAYKAGTLAMANSGANTSGSQFFIDFVDTGLPPQYSVFGQLISGEDVLATIEQIPVSGDTPLESLFIESIEIEIT